MPVLLQRLAGDFGFDPNLRLLESHMLPLHQSPKSCFVLVKIKNKSRIVFCSCKYIISQ